MKKYINRIEAKTSKCQSRISGEVNTKESGRNGTNFDQQRRLLQGLDIMERKRIPRKDRLLVLLFLISLPRR